MIAALLLLAIPIAPAQPKPIETTIAALRADPKRLDDKVVRLHGWVNHCAPHSCAIEERPASSPAGPGQSLAIADDAKFESTLAPLVPTYVELDARFDGNCAAAAACARLTVILLRGVIDPKTPPPED